MPDVISVSTILYLDNLDSEAMPILTRCPHLVAQQEGSPIITHYVGIGGSDFT
ncbi:hypothetical protein NIES39_O07000 [Arthrospira platensis NIES-39]|nr:hypothetical protein NIES39_O07000 [Arthrospira platensis NIES-39]